MSGDPYRAPDSDLEIPNEIEIPVAVLKKIRNGWIAALVSGVFTLGFTILAMLSADIGDLGGFFNAWTILDVVLTFGLAYGIYKRSRTASTIMFVYYVGSKIILYLEIGAVGNIIIAVVFTYLFFQAMVGTYQYHKCLKIS